MLAQRAPVTAQLTVASLVVAAGHRRAAGHPLGRAPPVLDRPLGHGLQCPGHGRPHLLARHPARAPASGSRSSWLPTSGFVPIWEEPARGLRFLVLPAFTLGAYVSAVLARFTRAALLETLFQDYVRTARAKGLGEGPVVGGHALRNALIPVVTVVGLQFGAFMGGAVITEAIFDYPGLGRMLLQAILTRDYTVVQGTILFVVVAFVVINLLTDLVYALLDPRIRYS